jgi:hypothetical protein
MDPISGISELFSTMMTYRTKLVESSNHLIQDQVSAYSDRFPPWDGFWHSQLDKWENCNYWMRGYPNRVAEYIFNLKDEEFVNIDFNLFEDDEGNLWNTINDALGFAVQTALSWVGVPEQLQELMDKASKELVSYITKDYDFQDGGLIRTELWNTNTGAGQWWGAWPDINGNSYLYRREFSNSYIKLRYNASLY